MKEITEQNISITETVTNEPLNKEYIEEQLYNVFIKYYN